MVDLANLEAEMALLGAILVNNDACDRVTSFLRPEHFFEAVHARIFEAAETMIRMGKLASPVTLKAYFDNDATLKEIGGPAYLARLATGATTIINAKEYGFIIYELAQRRSAIDVANSFAAAAGDVGENGDFRLTLANHVEAMQQLFDDGGGRKTSYTLGEAASATVVRMNRIRAGEVDRNAIKTGLAALDRQLGGLHRGEYTILGGRPSMGKTALACQLAYNVAGAGGGVFYASLEMPVALLTPRLIASRLWMPGQNTNLDYQRILRGQVSDQEMRWVESASKEMQSWPLVIDDAPGLSPGELEARAAVAKSRLERNGRSLDLLVVDHLHRMRHPGSTSKVSEYTEISARLAEMAKRLDCPVLALAQLNRSVESRDDKRPQLADLRESGSIEQDADVVLFVYREEYYLSRKRCNTVSAEADRLADLAAVKHRLDVIVEKQRSGPIGTVELWADVACNVVCDLADVQHLEHAA